MKQPIHEQLARCTSLFVQPHLDDVAFSCGASVARASDAGQHPVVVSVFSGPPAPGAVLGDAVAELHKKWGLGDRPWEARQEEDAAACAVLAATPLWLDYPDAPYRPGYRSFQDIVGSVRSEDDAMRDELEAELLALWRQSNDAVVHLPLGVGGHVDHQICHALGVALSDAGAQVRYYEDFPYGAIPGLLPARLATIGGVEVAELVDASAWMERRIKAMLCYASQVDVIFAADGMVPGPVEDAVHRYTSAVANGFLGAVTKKGPFAEVLYRLVGERGE